MKQRKRMSDGAAASGGPLGPGPKPSSAGFSLVEIMVVVVIIGLLAGAVTLKVGGYMDTAKENRVQSDIRAIERAIENYHVMHHRYPSPDAGLEALDALKNKTDPWGNRYRYNRPASRGDAPFEVFTLGEDGREGGEGPDADVYSWQLDDGEEG